MAAKKKEKSAADKRREAMLVYFNNLRDKKEDGVPIYTWAYCVKKTAEKFFYAPHTVETYVSQGTNK